MFYELNDVWFDVHIYACQGQRSCSNIRCGHNVWLNAWMNEWMNDKHTHSLPNSNPMWIRNKREQRNTQTANAIF